VTGVNDFASIEKPMYLGAVDYVSKPFTIEALLSQKRNRTVA
jgi:response regulator of citrate/malate metabolism